MSDEINPRSVTDESQLFQKEGVVIPVMAEYIHIGKKIVETEKIQFSKKVITDNYDMDLSTFKEEIVIERKPVNRYIEGDVPGIRIDGDTTIIPVVTEVIVKRLLLVEEVFITKHRIETVVPVNDLLRREEVVITRNSEPHASEDR